MTTSNDTPKVIEFLLTKGSIAIIDEQDSDLLQYKWSELVRSTTYAKSTKHINGKQQLLHRLILSRILGRELFPSEKVDHWDHNGLNNQRSNLRLATNTQNMANRQYVGNESGFKGVYPVRVNGKWAARIRLNGKNKGLGCYFTPEEAHEAYKNAAIAQWGEFACFD